MPRQLFNRERMTTVNVLCTLRFGKWIKREIRIFIFFLFVNERYRRCYKNQFNLKITHTLLFLSAPSNHLSFFIYVASHLRNY